MHNTYALITIISGACILSGGLGYSVGRYQAHLLDKLKALEERLNQPDEPEPEKPTVVMGVYAPPRPISPIPDKARKAGLVETKTPELLDWETKQELIKLEHDA